MTARTRLWLDLGMFAALLAAYNPTLTGLPVHEWLSIAVIVPLLLHLIINWEWTVRITTAFLDRLFHTSRLNLIVDTTLFVSTVGVMLSGFTVSQVALAAFGIASAPSAVWVALHAVTADMTVLGSEVGHRRGSALGCGAVTNRLRCKTRTNHVA